LTAQRYSGIYLLQFDNCACAAAHKSAQRSPEIFIAERFVSKLSTEQWAEARRLYGRGATFTAIATQFDITRGAVAKRARREGWAAPLNGPVGGVGSTGTAQAQDDFRLARRTLRRRIFRILDLDLKMILDLDLKIMELRMQKRLSDAETGAAPEGMSDDELKRLGTFKKTIQDHTEFSPDTEPSAGAAGRASAIGRAAASEADVFRREIAERIAKLIPPA
jgi:hypothetical protein